VAPPTSHRELAGHTFLPSHLIRDPFSITAFGSYFGVGSGKALGPIIDRSQFPPVILQGQKWYSYSGFAEQVDMDVRLLENLSARLSLGGGTYTGALAGEGSALVVGTNVQGSGDLVVKGSWQLGDQWRLAATFGASYGPALAVLVIQGLIDAIKAGEVTADQFVSSTETLTWHVGVSSAWAPTPYLGVMLEAEYLNPRKTGAATYSQNGAKLAADLELDALPLVRWLPLAVNGVYSLTAPIGSNGVTTTREFGFGLFYSGRKDLSLGLEAIWRQGRLENDLVSKDELTWLSFRYYW
jgi:hypothetical protein